MTKGILPWREMMGVAFSRLALSPHAFWSMTLKEFSAALEHGQQANQFGTLDRESLTDLMDKHPDNKG